MKNYKTIYHNISPALFYPCLKPRLHWACLVRDSWLWLENSHRLLVVLLSRRIGNRNFPVIVMSDCDWIHIHQPILEVHIAKVFNFWDIKHSTRAIAKVWPLKCQLAFNDHRLHNFISPSTKLCNQILGRTLDQLGRTLDQLLGRTLDQLGPTFDQLGSAVEGGKFETILLTQRPSF